MELANANDEKQENQKCGHFSIRGYVADIRKKDSKICWPFPTTINSNTDVEDQAPLPPLHVADFRWWGCENCLKKISVTSAESEVRDFANYQSFTFKPSASHHRSSVISSHVDASKLFSGLRRTSKERIHVGPNVDSHITVDLYDHEVNPSLCNDKKEEKALAVQPVRGDPCTSIGPNDGAEVTLKHTAACRTLSSSVGNVSLRYPPKKLLPNISTGQTAMSCDPSILCQHNDEFGRIVLGEKKQKRASIKTSTKMCRKENPKPRVGKVAISKNRGYAANVDKNEALSTATGHMSNIHPRGLDESDNKLPKEDEENNIDEDGSFPKRRTKKLRLLDDIIKSEALSTSCNSNKSSREENDDHIKTDDVLSKSLRDAFTRIGRHTDSKSPEPSEAKDQESGFVSKKKKRMPQIEDDVPFKIGCPTVNEELGAFKNEMSSSFLRRLDSLANSYLIKHGKNVSFDLLNKKGKMHHIEDREYSLVPPLEDVQSAFQNTGRELICTEAGSGCPKAAEDECFRRGSHSDMAMEAEAQSHDKRIIFGGSKNAKSRGKEWKTLPESSEEIINGRTRTIIGDIDPKYKKAAAVPFRHSQEALAACNQYDPIRISKFRNHDIGNKQNCIFPVGFGDEASQFENRPFSLLRHPEVPSDAYNYKKSIAQRHPMLLERQFDQTTSKNYDQASFDDIPMEIVELMAKNQHDRHRSTAEHAVSDGYCSSWNSDKGKVSGPDDLTNVLGNEMLQLFKERKSLTPHAHFNNEGSFVRRGGLTKRKMDDYISQGGGIRSPLHHQISQQEQYHLMMRSQASCHALPVASNFSISAPNGNFSNRNFSWNDDVPRHKCYPSNLKSSETSPMHPAFAQRGSGRDERYVWSSMGPNSAAFKDSNHQKLNTEASNFGTVSQCLDLFPHADVNVNHGTSSPNTIHLEKQISELVSETNDRPYVDHPFVCTDRGSEYQKTTGQLDFHANETIPAMHLLRLMHAGVSSTAPLHVEKDHDFSKQSSFPRNHPRSHFIELEAGKRKHIYHPETDYFLKNCNVGKSSHHNTSELKRNTVGTSIKIGDNMRSSFTTKCYGSNKWIPGSGLKFQAKEKAKSMKPPIDPRSRKSNRSTFENSAIDDMQKARLSASSSGPSSIQSQGIEDSAACFREDVSNKNGAAWPITRSDSTEICTVNRNPADFTIPEAGNVYMIGPGDLRRGKMSMPRGKSGLTHDLEGQKKQRMMRLTSI